MAFRKIKAGLVNSDIDQFIGEVGNLFFDIETGVLRLSNGVTPGGVIVSGGTNADVDLSAVDQHIIPAIDVTYDLGTETNRWRDLYLSGDTIKLGDASISATGDGISLPAGSTVGGVLIGSIRILGTVSSLLDLEAIIDPVAGDSYLVSFFSPLRLFTYDGIQFNDLGEFQGPRGEQGYTGSRGDFGYTGSIGLTGSQGDTGFTGSRGDFGYTGSLGYVGSQGDVGSRGDFGYTGSQGNLGYTGSKGDFGEEGFTGSQGIAGFTGSRGEKGADGTGVTIAGSSNTQSDLSINYSGNTGDGYVVKSTGNLWIWSGSEWNDVGRFVGYTGSQGYTGSTGQDGVIGRDGYTGSIGFTGSSGDIGYTGSAGDIGYTGSAGQDGIIGRDGYTGSAGDIGFTGSAGQDGVIGRDGYTGSQGDIGYTGSAVEGLVSDGVSSITIQSGYTLVFPDGSGQLSAAPRMYTNADAENGLSLSDLKPGDYYYDDVNAAIYICYDTGLGYFDILDLTVRA